MKGQEIGCLEAVIIGLGECDCIYEISIGKSNLMQLELLFGDDLR